MAVKTITIDMEAYNILSAEKMANESFSKVIKRRLRLNATASNLLRKLHMVVLDEDTLSEIDSIIEDRNKAFPDSPVLDEDS